MDALFRGCGWVDDGCFVRECCWVDDGCCVQMMLLGGWQILCYVFFWVDDGCFVIGCCWVDDGCCVQMMLLGGWQILCYGFCWVDDGCCTQRVLFGGWWMLCSEGVVGWMMDVVFRGCCWVDDGCCVQRVLLGGWWMLCLEGVGGWMKWALLIGVGGLTGPLNSCANCVSFCSYRRCAQSAGWIPSTVTDSPCGCVRFVLKHERYLYSSVFPCH